MLTQNEISKIFDDINYGNINFEDVDGLYPAPTLWTSLIAESIVTKLRYQNIFPFDVSPDVLGGIAIWYKNDFKEIWVSCMNEKIVSILYINRKLNTRIVENFIIESFNNIIKFLINE